MAFEDSSIKHMYKMRFITWDCLLLLPSVVSNAVIAPASYPFWQGPGCGKRKSPKLKTPKVIVGPFATSLILQLHSSVTSDKFISPPKYTFQLRRPTSCFPMLQILVSPLLGPEIDNAVLEAGRTIRNAMALNHSHHSACYHSPLRMSSYSWFTCTRFG